MNQETSRLMEMMADYYSQKMTDTKVILLSQDLEQYEPGLLMQAWARYRQKDTHGKMPTLAQLIENYPDGRPSAQEAWAMIPKKEGQSVVWSQEMRLAFGSCYPLLEDGNITNAFFVFREKYEDLVRDARLQKERPRWETSFGYEKSGRTVAVQEAVRKGRISIAQARAFLPEYEEPKKQLNSSFAKIGDAIKIALNKPEVTQ